ncbi:hypothetical protein Droror1_Dr00008488 [Drosera rotundifolia]
MVFGLVDGRRRLVCLGLWISVVWGGEFVADRGGEGGAVSTRLPALEVVVLGIYIVGPIADVIVFGVPPLCEGTVAMVD